MRDAVLGLGQFAGGNVGWALVQPRLSVIACSLLIFLRIRGSLRRPSPLQQHDGVDPPLRASLPFQRTEHHAPPSARH
jgi:hypothetical protein